jgi:hypothetical protein
MKREIAIACALLTITLIPALASADEPIRDRDTSHDMHRPVRHQVHHRYHRPAPPVQQERRH